MAGFFSGVEAAISGAVAGAVKSQSEWAGLKAQVAAGTLRMEPGVAEACAKACQVAHQKMYDHIDDVRRATRVDGMGTWESGLRLAQKFSEKADGAANNNSAAGVLTLHQQVLADMRDTFRAAGKVYAAAEQANVNAVRGAT